MEKNVSRDEIELLYRAICTLQTPEECGRFFSDVCTSNEIQSIAQRFKVAKMLKEKHTYAEVAAQTGASTATISRVNRSLTDGGSGYDIVLERLKEKE